MWGTECNLSCCKALSILLWWQVRGRTSWVPETAMRVWALHGRAAAWAEGSLCPSPALGATQVLRMRGMDQARPGSPLFQVQVQPLGITGCHKRTHGWVPHCRDRTPGSALSPHSCHQSHAGTQAEDAQVLASFLGHILHPSLVHSDHGAQAAVSSPSLE